jgi:FeS assembly protein SufD
MTAPGTRTADSPLAAGVEALASSGPASFGERRRAALDAYLSTPLPPRAQHLWRYTDPARLLPGDLRPSGSGIGPADAFPVQKGVSVSSLGPAFGEPGVSGRFATLSNGRSGKFEALNLALFPAGVVVEVAAGARPEKPIALVHGGNEVGADPAGTLACPRLLVLVGEGAEASLVEEFGAEGWNPSLVHAVTEVFLAPGARFIHAVINTFGPRVRANLVQRARVDRGASLTSISVGLGGEIVKVDATAVLAGEHARSEVLGLSFGTGRQHLDSHFFQDHAAPRTHSDLLVKAALSGRARASYTGQLRIAVDAPGSEAHQENRNLLLSEHSRADSIPELEILTHEVQCSHAAATGPLDPVQLFYLRTRGLSAAEAETMIVLGFLEPVFARIPGESIAAAVRARAAGALAARRLGGE